MKTNHTIVFTLTERLDVNHVVVLLLTTDKPMKTEDAKAAFSAALSKWVKTTASGKKAWRESFEDFNIGDYLQVESDKALVALLKKAGITKAHAESYAADLSTYHDEILVTV